MRFGDVPPEVPPQRSLDGLAPRFRVLVEDLVDALECQGFDPVVAESLRTDERQKYLFGFGRQYDDGRGVVTHSAVGHTSWHFYGLAVDVISRSRGWNPGSAFWTALGAEARIRGLVWGGDWRALSDFPHIQFGSGMPDSPSATHAEMHVRAGVAELWRALGAM